MDAAEQLPLEKTEPLPWVEICTRYPDQYVCLVDIERAELRIGRPRRVSALKYRTRSKRSGRARSVVGAAPNVAAASHRGCWPPPCVGIEACSARGARFDCVTAIPVQDPARAEPW